MDLKPRISYGRIKKTLNRTAIGIFVGERTEHDKINQPGPEDEIFFYPKEFYVFDNFSAFQITYKGTIFPTSEHAYQAMQFINTNQEIFDRIRNAKSAHDAQRIASENKEKEILNGIKRRKTL